MLNDLRLKLFITVPTSPEIPLLALGAFTQIHQTCNLIKFTNDPIKSADVMTCWKTSISTRKKQKAKETVHEINSPHISCSKHESK